MNIVWALVLVTSGWYGSRDEVRIIFPSEYECNRALVSVTSPREIVSKECIPFKLDRITKANAK